MKLCINGQDREFSELDRKPMLARLVELLEMKPDRIAIERNGAIVSRSTWGEVTLQNGDKLEVVQFVGGGVDPKVLERLRILRKMAYM